MAIKISVITPTLRPDSLKMNRKCLERQTFKDFEWLVVSPYEYKHATWVPEPAKKKETFYNLNAAWNAAFKVSKGDLIVSIVDLLYFPPDILERLWSHYKANPEACVTFLGNQYKEIVDGKPETVVWYDPRRQNKSFYQVDPLYFELCIASLPRKGIYDVGGVDEEYDRGAAVSEKELCKRLEKKGYTFWTDETLEYRALYHERIGGMEEWDKHYMTSCILYTKHTKEIAEGKRLKLDYL